MTPKSIFKQSGNRFAAENATNIESRARSHARPDSTMAESGLAAVSSPAANEA
jgi:hypothetical protein